MIAVATMASTLASGQRSADAAGARGAGWPTFGERRVSATHGGVCRARVGGSARLAAAERVLRVEHLEGPAVEPVEESANLAHLTSSLVSSTRYNARVSESFPKLSVNRITPIRLREVTT